MTANTNVAPVEKWVHGILALAVMNTVIQRPAPALVMIEAVQRLYWIGRFRAALAARIDQVQRAERIYWDAEPSPLVGG